MNLLVADLQDLIGRSVGDSIKVEIRHSSAKLHRLVERHRLIANAPPIALKHERAKWDAQWRGRLRSNCHWNSSGREGLSDAHRSLQVHRAKADGRLARLSRTCASSSSTRMARPGPVPTRPCSDLRRRPGRRHNGSVYAGAISLGVAPTPTSSPPCQEGAASAAASAKFRSLTLLTVRPSGAPAKPP